MDKMYHCILNYNYILIFVIFQIGIPSIIFSLKYRIYDLFVFSIILFWGSQRIPRISFLDFDLQNHPLFAICW